MTVGSHSEENYGWDGRKDYKNFTLQIPGLLNWIKYEQRSIQLFSSLNWTELNKVKILNVERWTSKLEKKYSVQFTVKKKFQKSEKNMPKYSKIILNSFGNICYVFWNSLCLHT